jgi:hypothetical protein
MGAFSRQGVSTNAPGSGSRRIGSVAGIHTPAGRTPRQRPLISQLIALEWDVLRLEARETEKGKLSAHDRIALATWRRHFREALRQLGPPAKAKPSPADHLASHTAGRTTADILAGHAA